MTAQHHNQAPSPLSDLDALRIPREAPVPAGTFERAALSVELDHWWHRLTLGQRAALRLAHDA